MKNTFYFALLACFTLQSCIVVISSGKKSQVTTPKTSSTNKVGTEKSETVFNQKLADSLGADNYGMKNYFMVILKTGENDKTITDKAKRSELFKTHFSNMEKLSKEGKLVVAGPFGKNQLSYRGIFIFNAKTEDEVKEFLSGDLTIKEGIFDYELLPWYGSAALPMYLKYHEKVAKENP